MGFLNFKKMKISSLKKAFVSVSFAPGGSDGCFGFVVKAIELET